MEIPNYDTGKKSNNGFQRLYNYMPNDTFRMLLASLCTSAPSPQKNREGNVCVMASLILFRHNFA